MGIEKKKGADVKNAIEYLEWRFNRSRELMEDVKYREESLRWLNVAVQNDYSYMFQWMGVPIIQFPSDILLIQEAVFRSKANKIVEIGIARGGMTLFLASLLKLIHGSQESTVIGVDISVSSHTYDALNNSALKGNVLLIQGDSASKDTQAQVSQHVKKEDKVIVILDSNHTHAHVYKELQFYSDMVSKGSFLIVMDTAIEYLDPENVGEDKEWSCGNNPKTAVDEFLSRYPNTFVLDEELNSRSLPGAAHGGFLRRV
jgi:cephalosporin hydroxylase